MNDTDYERLVDLLDGSTLSTEAVDCLLAATDGEAALAAYLAGEPAVRRDLSGDVAQVPPARAYLEEIAVEGFRGVGPAARLPFAPAPGLTLVVGRNGSGKSSFAEGLEILLTGTCQRWADRTKVWQEGWRNLHHDGDVRVRARFRIDGEPVPLEVAGRWAPGAKLDEGEVAVGGPVAAWSELGWDAPLDRYRPLLSYNELGTMFSTRAAHLYEALSAVLGLEGFDATLATLRQARLARERSEKDEKTARAALRSALAGSDDPRAAAVGELLAARAPDPEAVHLAAGDDTDTGGSSGLTALAALELPTDEEIAAAFTAVGELQGRLSEIATTDADRLEALAGLLEAGMGFQHDHGGAFPADCPLCGAGGRLDESWALRVSAEIEALRHQSAAVRETRDALAGALRAARSLFAGPVQRAIDDAQGAGLELAAARAAAEAWGRGAARRRRPVDRRRGDGGPATAVGARGGAGPRPG